MTSHQKVPRRRYFSDDNIRDIRRRHREGHTQTQIAKHYNTGPVAINNIINLVTYKHVPFDDE